MFIQARYIPGYKGIGKDAWETALAKDVKIHNL